MVLGGRLPARLDGLCDSLNGEAPVVVRVNTLRTSVEECRTALAAEGIAAEPTRWSPVGLVLPKRVNVRTLRVYLDGWFELQDEGSQLIGFLAGPSPGERVVDACAGGGGKTLHCAALMGNSGEILAIDNDPRRLGHLDERLVRSGVTIVRTAVAGRDEGIIAEWKWAGRSGPRGCPVHRLRHAPPQSGFKLWLGEDDVAKMSRLQRSILSDYARLVKPGGRLVYSTCSLHRSENEEVVGDFLASAPEFRQENAAARLAESGITVDGVTSPTITLLPHRHGTDGFFMASLIRSGPKDD